MQNFQNSADKSLWAFEDDVVVTDTHGTYSFATPTGVTLAVPSTLQPYTPPAPTPAVLLAEAQAAQILVLKNACINAITSGYSSTALGSTYTYPSALTDQLNMAASVIASQLPGLASGWTTVFWCSDTAGAWAMRPHTAAQIQQAGSDGKAWVTAQQVKLASLTSQIAAATTVAAVQAIIW